jgi:hypothetical protein
MPPPPSLAVQHGRATQLAGEKLQKHDRYNKTMSNSALLPNTAASAGITSTALSARLFFSSLRIVTAERRKPLSLTIGYF